MDAIHLSVTARKTMSPGRATVIRNQSRKPSVPAPFTITKAASMVRQNHAADLLMGEKPDRGAATAADCWKQLPCRSIVCVEAEMKLRAKPNLKVEGSDNPA